jgi:hypothetical protein
VVETLDVIDMGTSVLLDAQVHDTFTAETALASLAQTRHPYGLPAQLTLDRDPRWVGSPHGSDFPSALLRFGACLGIHIQVCDPHHPQQNELDAYCTPSARDGDGVVDGLVQCLRRTVQPQLSRGVFSGAAPHTQQEVQAVTQQFEQHYNYERPHQGLSCGNRPPRTAFPRLPTLPPLPDLINPDRWLEESSGLLVLRTVSRNGMVSIDLKDYYIGRAFAGQRVALHLSAKDHCWIVIQGSQRLKTLPLKGLFGVALPFEAYVHLME